MKNETKEDKKPKEKGAGKKSCLVILSEGQEDVGSMPT